MSNAQHLVQRTPHRLRRRADRNLRWSGLPQKRPGPLPNTVARINQNPDLGFLTNTRTLFQYVSTRLLTSNEPDA